jgi:hypothetical protein
MAVKKKESDGEAPKIQKIEYTLLKNLGSNKDGSPKKAKGSKVKLTEEQVNHYKSLKLI